MSFYQPDKAVSGPAYGAGFRVFREQNRIIRGGLEKFVYAYVGISDIFLRVIDS